MNNKIVQRSTSERTVDLIDNMKLVKKHFHVAYICILIDIPYIIHRHTFLPLSNWFIPIIFVIIIIIRIVSLSCIMAVYRVNSPIEYQTVKP